MASHARKNAARQQQELSGLNRRAALQDIRNTLPPAPQARNAARLPSSQVDSAVVPAELIALVQDFSRWGRRHLDEAVRAAHRNVDQPGEWHRLVLYGLTDALAYNFLVVGAIAGYLQEQGIDADLLCRHLQSPNPDRYVTQKALDLLAGLMGRPATEGQPEPTWHFVGQQIAQHAVEPSAE
ncbi:hypothetical protein AR457_39655 [Streptomyces agglomeratus]|uniref:hypothetical protein n=1 Tax=Streptomyces agglomeratus TaxID=285458 RepID=UPI000854942D|nr:hypothetical protein [Streptomyces agglomeratus]OEJ22027.1 hypothetical protein AR457_39655 [Streptomyces agglomeratus]